MTDIHIPAAALDAGARHGYGNFEGWLHVDPFNDPIAWEELTEEQRDEYRRMVRAAFVAMVENWPRMMMTDHPEWALPALILPLTEKQDDKA